MISYIFFIFLLVVSVRSDCWETGCQLDSWAVKGCEQYGRYEAGRRWCSGGNIYNCCSRDNPPPPPPPSTGSSAASITYDEFSRGVTYNGYPTPTQAQFNSFKNGLSKGDISSKQEAAMMVANILQESDGLRAKREYACIGNNCPGSYRTPNCDYPNQYYFGRGYIQLSWCYNYRSASNDLFRDDRLVRNPDLVASDEQLAWDTAFWYWRTRVHSQPGVQDGRFGATTRAINGGLECDGPYKDKARKRYAMYGKVRQAYGLPGPGDERGCYN